MKRGSISKFLWVLLCIVILLCLVFAFFFVFKFTNGGKETLKTFYLVHNGKTITASESSMYFEPEKEQRFDVKYLFEDSENAKKYLVSIVPNPDMDFKFTVDGVQGRWGGLGDLSDVFNLKVESTYFTFLPPSDASVSAVLEKKFPNGKVVVDEVKVYEDSFLYKLVITSYDGKITFEIVFSSFVDIKLKSFDIDKSSVVF